MKIRRITTDDERRELSLPIQAYGFQPSPASKAEFSKLLAAQRFYGEHVTLVAEEDGAAVADVSAVPMRQNVRGAVYAMAGVAGLATLPHARRRGYGRALVTEILGLMRDSGCALSALYPFRASFYERFGFVGLPQSLSVTFSPSDMGWLVRRELPGKVQWGPVADFYDDYVDFVRQLLGSRHGFSLLPDSRMDQLRKDEDRWLAVAWADGAVAGAVPYRVTGFAGDLVADDLLSSGALGRALLLRFFAAHTDQVARIRVRVPPGEMPELWATDLDVVAETRVSFPAAPAPMGRVLSLDGLTGMMVGNARVTIQVVDDPFLSGCYELDGKTGALEVRPAATAEADATLTAAGLSALVYGALDPDDVLVRGFGQMQAEDAALLRELFPRRVPYLFARF